MPHTAHSKREWKAKNTLPLWLPANPSGPPASGEPEPPGAETGTHGGLRNRAEPRGVPAAAGRGLHVQPWQPAGMAMGLDAWSLVHRQTQPVWWQGAGSRAQGDAPRSMGSSPGMLAAGRGEKAGPPAHVLPAPVCPPAQGPDLGEELGPQGVFLGGVRGHTLPPIQHNGSEESWRTHRGVKTIKPENILLPFAACLPGSGEICPLSPNDERWKRSRQRSCVSVPTHRRFEACQDHRADLHPIVTGCQRMKTPAALHASP